MARNYIHTIFSDAARERQARHGSRAAYARMEAGADGSPDQLTAREIDFITARDSFYVASVTPHGWPYVQHRGGPAGFLRHIGGNRIGFADFAGNRQYISTANLSHDPRVALFLMDYASRRRLKMVGHASIIEIADDAAAVAAMMPSASATPERCFQIDIVGWEWNCSQHITPRFSESEVAALIEPLSDEIARLRAELHAVNGKLSGASE